MFLNTKFTAPWKLNRDYYFPFRHNPWFVVSPVNYSYSDLCIDYISVFERPSFCMSHYSSLKILSPKKNDFFKLQSLDREQAITKCGLTNIFRMKLQMPRHQCPRCSWSWWLDINCLFIYFIFLFVFLLFLFSGPHDPTVLTENVLCG